MVWHLDSIQRFVLEQGLNAPSFKNFAQAVTNDNNDGIIYACGLPNAGLSLTAALLSLVSRRPVCIVTSSAERSTEIFDDLEHYGHPAAHHLPKWEILPYEREEPVVENMAKTLDTSYSLLALSKNPPESHPLNFEIAFNKLDKQKASPVFVASIEACLQRVLSFELLEDHSLRVEWGERIDIEQLAERLVYAGYEREPMVEGRGEFSIRGGIIDIFPVNFENPIRLDLFGDEVESIRWFDLSTQRSLKQKDIPESIIIPPARLNRLMSDLAREGNTLSVFPELLPGNTIFILDERERFEETSEKYAELVERQYNEALREEHKPERTEEWLEPPAPAKLYASLAEVEEDLENRPRAVHNRLPVEQSERAPIRFNAASFTDLEPSLDKYLQLIRGKQHEDFLTVVICDNDGQVMRLDELMREHEISAIQALEKDRFRTDISRRDVLTGYPDILLTVGHLHTGMIWHDARLLLVTDREMFGRYKRRQIYRKIYKGAPIRSASDIQRGDYVVHVDHGIGRFLGIRQQVLDGRHTDLLELEYAEGNKLLVPMDKIRNVQKYAAGESEARPTLDKLGSTKWLKRKKKSQEQIEKMAKDLLDLYAKRETVRSHTYDTDSHWQQEFEASFIYQETPDQIEAIRAVKEDLSSEKPMDRLVCGDVGYGKTEVAIRAAFKAIEEKKQVAVLCPTTILAQQHWKTFTERFAEYPIKIEMLSRFRTPKQQREIIKQLRLGEIDLIVGTHRLLSKDVEFADLGLLVVDEEQRFGVKHKEKLKQMRTTVDVITLTATPIPRTLYMSLSGLRDMSLIQTPPENRQPIKTRIIHFDKEMIKEAILRELNRGGQVYFVHNRVHNIHDVAKQLEEVVPQAKIAVAHGQMDNRTLEKVMLQFINGDFDILLSTTIIENGLDIPNVNTIVINRADAFGLAQLYQLRGRVGRDVRRAYAYMIVPKGQPITEPAARRLAAIEEFTDLGHGFDIAMRDMEIRGTGNILGAEQHGVMLQIGFELYCDMLNQAVQRMKGRAVEEDRPVEVQWKCDVYIPSDYIPVESQRVNIYKKLATIRSLRAVDDIADELRDRYGDPPDPVNNLLEITRLRILGRMAELDRISVTKNGFKIFPAGNVVEYVARLGGMEKDIDEIENFKVDADEGISLALRDGAANEKMAAAIRILRTMSEKPATVN